VKINLSTQASEYKLKPVEIIGKTDQVHSEPKNSSFELKAEFEAKLQKFDKVEHLQNALGEHDLTLKFRKDEETNRLVVELIDSKTGVAVRQMPSEVSLKLGAAFAKLQGQLLDEHI